MVLSMPRMSFRDWAITLYAVVWAVVVVVTKFQGDAVTFEMFGWLAAGIVAIRIAFRDDKPEGGAPQ